MRTPPPPTRASCNVADCMTALLANSGKQPLSLLAKFVAVAVSPVAPELVGNVVAAVNFLN